MSVNIQKKNHQMSTRSIRDIVDVLSRASDDDLIMYFDFKTTMDALHTALRSSSQRATLVQIVREYGWDVFDRESK